MRPRITLIELSPNLRPNFYRNFLFKLRFNLVHFDTLCVYIIFSATGTTVSSLRPVYAVELIQNGKKWNREFHNDLLLIKLLVQIKSRPSS